MTRILDFSPYLLTYWGPNDKFLLEKIIKPKIHALIGDSWGFVGACAPYPLAVHPLVYIC